MVRQNSSSGSKSLAVFPVEDPQPPYASRKKTEGTSTLNIKMKQTIWLEFYQITGNGNGYVLLIEALNNLSLANKTLEN